MDIGKSHNNKVLRKISLVLIFTLIFKAFTLILKYIIRVTMISQNQSYI